MLAKELLVEDVPFLTPEDTLQKVSAWMDEFKFVDLPVVVENKFCGFIDESTIFEIDNWDDTIQKHKSLLKDFCVAPDEHIFDVVNKINLNKLSMIAIVDENKDFLGTTTREHIFRVIADMSLISDIGAILELDMNSNDYSMSQISQIIESNNAKILGSFVTSQPDSKKIKVTLKINKTDINAILSTFDRYDYTVLASYNQNDAQDNYRNRYNHLMNYLNL